MNEFVNLFTKAIFFGTVILYGALGEILTEKSGHLNLGVPGIMCLGGIGGLFFASLYEFGVSSPSAVLCLLISIAGALIGSVLGGLIYSFLTVTLRANQNVTGLTLTIFGSGLANYIGQLLNLQFGGAGQFSLNVTAGVFRSTVHFTDGWGVIDRLFLSYGFMVYLAIVIAVLLAFFLNRTSAGLNLRAVGENPATADAAGINVTKYKYLATCIGAAISGLGGLYFVMDYTKGVWASSANIEALGWLAVALVIFATWKPLRSIWGAYLFGSLYWLYELVPNRNTSGEELIKALPYVVTVIVLISVSIRRKREDQPPASLGLPYFREDR